MVSIDGGLLSDVVFCDFRGRRSRVQQISGDPACQGRAVQRAQVSLCSSNSIINTRTSAIKYMQYVKLHIWTLKLRQKHRQYCKLSESALFCIKMKHTKTSANIYKYAPSIQINAKWISALVLNSVHQEHNDRMYIWFGHFIHFVL